MGPGAWASGVDTAVAGGSIPPKRARATRILTYGKKDDVLLVVQKEGIDRFHFAKPIPLLRNGERKEAPVRCGWTARASNSALGRSERLLGLVGSRQRFVRCGHWSDHGNATRRRTKSTASDFNQIN